MGAEHEETQYLQIIFLSNITDSKEVSKRFGHLLIVNI